MSSDLIILRAFHSEGEARVVESFLKAKGVHAEVFGGRVPYAAAVTINGGPFKLMVRAEEQTEAMKHLRLVEGGLPSTKPVVRPLHVWTARLLFFAFVLFMAWNLAHLLWQ